MQDAAAPRASVKLNVYDLGEFNGYMKWLGVGVYHSGVEVYGKEYAFGAHSYECSGVFSTAPLEAPGDVVFNTKVDIGDTHLTEQEVAELVEQMGQRYQGTCYHLLQTNCNHFSHDFCVALCGKKPPAWVNRLAECLVTVHCLLPPSWLPPLKPPAMNPDDPLRNEAISPPNGEPAEGLSAAFGAASPSDSSRLGGGLFAAQEPSTMDGHGASQMGSGHADSLLTVSGERLSQRQGPQGPPQSRRKHRVT